MTAAGVADDDHADETVTVTHAIDADNTTDDSYDSVTVAGVTVKVTDDDTAAVTVSKTEFTVGEAGDGTYTVKLATRPSGNVVVDVSSGDTAAATVTPVKLTFTTSNWSAVQSVTVTGVQDAGYANNEVSVSHSIDMTGTLDTVYDALSSLGSVTVTVTDDDSAGVTVREATLTVDEGSEGTYTVKLDAQPTGNVVVGVTSADTAAATVTPAKLTFTTSNWDDAQTVTAAGVADDDHRNETVTVTHAINQADTADTVYDDVSSVTVSVSVTDDDTAAVTVSDTSLSVGEAGDGTYTVKLVTRPSGNVVIDVTSADTGAATVSPAKLTFTTSTWDSAQTVTAAGVADDDHVNETVTVSHTIDADNTADSAYDSVTVAGVSVTVTDDDTAAVMVSKTELTVGEAGDGTYTVKLVTRPSGNVVVGVTSGDTGAVSVSPVKLTFTTSTWDSAQTVTAAGVADDDHVDETVTVSHTIDATNTADDDYDSVTVAGVSVTVTDDDSAGVTVSGTTLTVDEGSEGTYTVKLDAQPTGNVVVGVSSGDTAAATVTPVKLTFTTSNWSAVQSVTVTGVQDAGYANNEVSVSHSIDMTGTLDTVYDALSSLGSVTVTVTDDDSAGVTVSEATLTVDEGSEGTYTVKLDAQPTGNVVVGVSSGDTAAATVTPAKLTFTTSNWDDAQTVTAAGVADDDHRNETVTVTHAINQADTADTVYDDVSSVTVSVSVTDDDTAGVTVSGNTLTVTEGATGTYTVKLATQPSGNVVVGVTSADTAAATVTPAKLTFTTTNWDDAQTVTAAGVADDDHRNETVTVTHAINQADTADTVYDDVSSVTVSVSVTDDDTAGVTVSGNTLTVTEGATGTYTVKLATQPSGNVVVGVTSADTAAATVTPAKLTFTTTNWDDAQTVTAAGVADDDHVNETVTVSHTIDADNTADDDYDSVTVAGVSVTVTDDDTAGVTVSEATLTVDEGSEGTYTVKLVTRPSGNVVIGVSSGDTAAATVSPVKLTFTTSNWSAVQSVTVTGVQDSGYADNEVSVSHSIDMTGTLDTVYDALSSLGSVTVTVTDDDSAGVTVSEATLTVDEGSEGTYTVKLDAQPSGNVVVDVSSGDTAAVTVSPVKLTFTTSNWSAVQSVTVTGVQDSGYANNEVSVSHSIDMTGTLDTVYDALSSLGSVTVTVTDDDSAGVTVSGTTLTVDEGSEGTYTVKLDAQPTGNVVVDVASGDTAAVTVSPVKLTFTTSNWSAVQSVTVTGVQDAGYANNEVSVSHSIDMTGTADTVYDALSSLGSVTVTVTDDDSAGVTVSGTTLTVDEGSEGTYTVKLDAQPTGNVVVGVSSGDTAAATVTPAKLTFTTSNWDDAQTVTAAGVADDDHRNETVTVTHAINQADTADTVYDDVSSVTVSVSVTDDDTAGVTVSDTSLSVGEAGDGTYTVKLATQPSGDVVVGVTSADTAAATVTPAKLTFTTTNWDDAQTVTAAGVADDDHRNETVTVTHAINQADTADTVYDDVSSVTVSVSVTDDDTAGVTVSGNTLTVTEGATGTYTVKLATQPSGNVVVDVTSADTAAATVTPVKMTFTTSNWSAVQSVTVTGVQDAGYANNEVSVSHSIDTANTADTVYDALSSLGSVTVTVTDDDSAGVTVSEATLTVGEGSEGTYTVRLDAQPTGNVVVGVTSGDTAAATVIPVKLTFTTSDWSAAQSVTVTGVQDAGYANNEVSVSHSIDMTGTADTVYDALSSLGSVTVTVTDDDSAGVTVSETSLTVVENAPVRYTVVLDAQPADSVTVTATSQALGKATVSAALVFTTDNWFTPQTFTVIGVEAGSSSITHAAVSSDAGYQINAIGTVIVTVTVPPQVFIPPPPPPPPTTLVLTTSADDNAVVEGASVIVTATLDQAAISAVLVTLTTAGTATEGTDYTLPAAVTIAVGETTASGTVQITDDANAEDPETIVLTAVGTGLTVTPVTLTVTDNAADETEDGDPEEIDPVDPEQDPDDPEQDPDDTDDSGLEDIDGGETGEIPALPVRVVACRSDSDAAITPFTDIGQTAFTNDIECIYAIEVTTGTSETTFSPDDTVTRGQMASFMARLYEKLKGASAPVVSTPFIDVDQGSYAYDDVSRVYGLGLTTGTSETTFSPGETVTRGQMASFMARLYEKLKGASAPVVSTPFTDVDKDSFAYDDVSRIYGLGLTTGTSETTFSPNDTVTREQMASFLARLYRVLTVEPNQD